MTSTGVIPRLVDLLPKCLEDLSISYSDRDIYQMGICDLIDDQRFPKLASIRIERGNDHARYLWVEQNIRVDDADGGDYGRDMRTRPGILELEEVVRNTVGKWKIRTQAWVIESRRVVQDF